MTISSINSVVGSKTRSVSTLSKVVFSDRNCQDNFRTIRWGRAAKSRLVVSLQRLELIIVMVSFVAMVLFSSPSTAVVTAGTAESGNSSEGTAADSTTSNSIVTIPLIPYRVQRRRHLELARRLEMIDRNAGYPVRKRPQLLSQQRQMIQQNQQQQQQLQDESSTHNIDIIINNNNTHYSSRIDQEDLEHYPAELVAAVYQGYGTHYADLWCGTPPQRQTVIVDTGSGVTAFPCGECKDCGVPNYHIDPLFTEKDSTTFKSLTCQECLRGSCSIDKNICTIGQAYQEGSSWNAYEALDTCYVGGLHNHPVDELPADSTNVDDLNPYHARMFSFPMKFGCQTRLTGLFKTQLADGIMGMDVAPPSYWWQMYDANKISHKSFSLCFSRQDQADPSGTEAGAMSFGGTDTRLHKTDMVYSATDEGSTGFFVVHVKKVWLRGPGFGESALPTTSTGNKNKNGDDLKHIMLKLTESEINGNRVIVDSGTTDTYFSRKFGSAFTEAWKQMTGTEYNHNPVDYLTKEELLNNLPTILFQLKGATDLNKAVLDRKSSTTTAIAGLANDLDPDNPYDVILAIPPTHYFEWDEEVNKYVSRFYVDDSNGGVIGANAIMGHDVYFDVERGRIGWAESDCDHTAMVSSYTDKNSDSSGGSSSSSSNSDNSMGNGNDGTGTKVDDTDPLNNKNDFTKPYVDEGDEFVDTNAQLDNSQSMPIGFCSGIGCQLLVTIVIVLSVTCVAWRLVRKSPAGSPNYDLTHGNELEMSSNAAHNYDEDDFATGSGAIKYRSNGSIGNNNMNNSSGNHKIV